MIHHVGYELRLSLSLIHAAHDAEADVRIALLHESGDDGVERTLAGRQRVRVRCIERESAAPVVEMESEVVDHDPGTPDVGDALYPGDDVALVIHDGEVDGVS